MDRRWLEGIVRALLQILRIPVQGLLCDVQEEYTAALEERERGYSELLEELRVLRRRCPPQPSAASSARACAVVECHTCSSQPAHMSARTSGKVCGGDNSMELL